MISKKNIKSLFKSLGLLTVVEKLNFLKVKLQNHQLNNQFLTEYSNVKLPPDFYLYETFALDYHKYYFGGKEAATWIINHLNKYVEFKNKAILDWGCGPSRVLRHLPNLLDESNSFFGSDYNNKYVDWSKKNINNIEVVKNNLSPPLLFKDNFFDIIYSISVFTHLSEKMHFQWIKELNRVSKKGGLLFLTVHGKSFRQKLLKEERVLFDSNKLVEQSYKVEGNRLYASYQHPIFFKKLIENNGFKILDHIEGDIRNKRPQQDVWIIRKIS